MPQLDDEEKKKSRKSAHQKNLKQTGNAKKKLEVLQRQFNDPLLSTKGVCDATSSHFGGPLNSLDRELWSPSGEIGQRNIIGNQRLIGTDGEV